MNEIRAYAPLLSPSEVAKPLSHQFTLPAPTAGQPDLNFFPGEIPLPSSFPALEAEPLVLPEWWPKQIKEAGSTAGHESNHVLLGWSLGIQAEAVSINPGPGYRGITIFSGNLEYHPDAFQLIACGGAVNPVGKEAEGYGHHHLPGSDLHVADRLSSITGRSVEQSVESAKKRLESIPEKVRELVAGVIQTLESVKNSTQINLIIEKAYELYRRETDIKYETLETESETQRETSHEAFDASILAGDRTVIITGNDGITYYGIIREEKDPFEKPAENFHCENCTGEEAHASDCKKKDRDAAEKSNPIESSSTSLPTEAEVFNRRAHLSFVK